MFASSSSILLAGFILLPKWNAPPPTAGDAIGEAREEEDQPQFTSYNLHLAGCIGKESKPIVDGDDSSRDHFAGGFAGRHSAAAGSTCFPFSLYR